MLEGSGKALLFDIDGRLADTDALHLEAFNQVFGLHGHAFDLARFSKELQGFSNTSISERFPAQKGQRAWIHEIGGQSLVPPRPTSKIQVHGAWKQRTLNSPCFGSNEFVPRDNQGETVLIQIVALYEFGI